MTSRATIPSRHSPTRERVSLFARVVLGGVMIYFGLAKALDPVGFLKLVRDYDMVRQPWLLNTIAGGLPWIEVVCGLFLIVGIAVRGTAALVLAMLLGFTVIIMQRAIALAEAMDVAFCAIKFDCGCGAGEVVACYKLAENAALMLLAAVTLVGASARGCWRFSLFRSTRS